MRLGHRDALLLSLLAEAPQIMAMRSPLRAAVFNAVLLRDYQLDLLRRAAALFAQGYRRVLIVLPTGGGKTVLAGEALRCANENAETGHFLVHRKELLDQTSRSFSDFSLPHDFIAAGREFRGDVLTTLAGAATLVNRLNITLPPGLMIVDEAHHSAAATWASIFAAMPDTYVLGLTATPERHDGKGLDPYFDVMIEGPSVAELIARGFLSPYEYFAPSQPDMTGVRTDQQAERIMDQPDLVGDMVEHYLRLAKDQAGIVFAHSVKHSQHLVDAYRAHGVRAAHIDGDMSDRERERVDAMFRARDVDILSNCALLGEGYDVPGVVYCGLGRRTQSLGWFQQMVGRALRPIYGSAGDRESDEGRLAAIASGPKRAAVIADHASNVFKHGFPDAELHWSLQGKSGRKASAGAANDDADPVRQCLKCYRVFPSRIRVCPGCGAEAAPTAKEIKVADGELLKLERETAKHYAAVQRKVEERACTGLGDFIRLAEERGYQNPEGWARMKMQHRRDYAGR